MIDVTFISDDGKTKVLLASGIEMVTETIRVTASANVEEVPVAGAAVGQTFDHGNRFNRVEIGPILRSEDDAGKEIGRAHV